ncbi:hypothetical protein Enr10x_26920 [Gimesia panareensis]|uniref:Uncharacterized protein n=1 Tax=Gimesia panareensis TaxID=2527978 RepID=A0A517Q6X5_9PLAN|nr:hypothetical protein [Gimesia panareensis]QDT27375.1 hypothetical protein Enr10x_26920 [Gimesia panareensis]
MNDRILLSEARWGLSKIWFIWGGMLFLIIVIQSIFGRYGEQVKEAWSWFIPTIVPTLSLMMGVLGAEAMLSNDDVRNVKKNFYIITWWLSFGYLLVLSVTILLEPFAPMKTIDLYLLSNFWLSPFQGIVGGGVALLFTSQRKESPAETVPPAAE